MIVAYIENLLGDLQEAFCFQQISPLVKMLAPRMVFYFNVVLDDPEHAFFGLEVSILLDGFERALNPMGHLHA